MPQANPRLVARPGWLATAALAVAGCGLDSGGKPSDVRVGGGATAAATVFLPTISQAAPSQVAAGGTGFHLMVNGANLTPGTVVRWNGEDRSTRFVSSTQVTAQITPADVAQAGTARVSVFTEGAGGGSSSSLDVAITTGNDSCFAPVNLAIHPSGTFAYLINGGCSPHNSGYVATRPIEPATSRLGNVDLASVPLGPMGSSIVVDPTGRFVYAAHRGDDASDARLSSYRIDATSGALRPTGEVRGLCQAATEGDCAPVSLTIEPSGRFANMPSPSLSGGAPGRLSVYAIDAVTGALTPAASADAGYGPVVSVIDPAGRFAYVANYLSNDISRYAVNAATGALSPYGAIATVRAPVGLAVHPSGRYVYAWGELSTEIWTYTVDATSGVLGLVGTVSAVGYVDLETVVMALHPSGSAAYVVVQYGELQTYDIEPGSGALKRVDRLRR